MAAAFLVMDLPFLLLFLGLDIGVWAVAFMCAPLVYFAFWLNPLCCRGENPNCGF